MVTPVRDVMSWLTLSIRPDCRAADALQILLDSDSDVLCVVDEDDRFLGLVLDASLIKLDLTGQLHDATAADMLHRNPQCLTPESNISEAIKLFREAGISRIPVVREGRLMGLLSRRETLRWLARQRTQSATMAATPPTTQQPSTPSPEPIARPKFLTASPGAALASVCVERFAN